MLFVKNGLSCYFNHSPPYSTSPVSKLQKKTSKLISQTVQFTILVEEMIILIYNNGDDSVLIELLS